MKNVKRGFVYLVGIFFIALSVSISIKIGLGVTPVSAIPYVLKVIFNKDQGQMVTLFFAFLILLQILILRKEFQLKNLGQIIFAFVFGSFVDLTGKLLVFPTPESYLVKLLFLGVSIFSLALGVILYLEAQILPLPPEGLTLAIDKKTDLHLHQIKVYVDSSFVIIAALLSLLYFKRLEGVREGTILAAVLAGKVMFWLQRHFRRVFLGIRHWMVGKSPHH